MRRLVDANTLKDEMRAGCVPIDLGGITGITGDDDSIEDYIDAAPTVEAIPVSWLREKMDGYAAKLRSTELAALVTVMQMWEQEGKR